MPADGNTHFTQSTLLALIEHPSIILFDEINAASPGQLFKLHELLDSRSVYVPQANRGAGRLFKAHPECRFFLAANPTGGKYIGTNKFNVALPSRNVIIRVPQFTTEELKSLLSIKEEVKKPLLKFYEELRKMAEEQSLRYEISLRNLKHFCELYSVGLNLKSCLEMAILNHVYVSCGEDKQNAALILARSKFGRRLEND